MKVTSIFFTLFAIAVARAAAVPVLAQDPIKDVSGPFGAVDDSFLTSHESSDHKILIFKRSTVEDDCDRRFPVPTNKTNDGGKNGGNGKPRPLPKGLNSSIQRLTKKIQDTLSKNGFSDVDLKLENFDNATNFYDIVKAYKAMDDILAKLPESTQKAIRKTIEEVTKSKAGSLMLKHGATLMGYMEEFNKICKAIGEGFFNS
ncbi:MAG: hypothetical protein J3Q66DRAFT_359037 [Benniella sp.]|nr:MAG: hypothetical protein J3Q66DRAFT_359037 [Benniella sp.]